MERHSIAVNGNRRYYCLCGSGSVHDDLRLGIMKLARQRERDKCEVRTPLLTLTGS
jgi:hypothetical protein